MRQRKSRQRESKGEIQIREGKRERDDRRERDKRIGTSAIEEDR